MIKPTVEDESQTYRPVQPVATPASVIGTPADHQGDGVAPTAHQGDTEEEVEDTHRCGKCGVEFTTLEDYIKHKLYGDKCRVSALIWKEMSYWQVHS